MSEVSERRLRNGSKSEWIRLWIGFLEEEARNPTINVVMKAQDRRWSWLGHVLRMPEHRLERKVLLKLCQTYSRDAFLGRTKPKVSKTLLKMSKDRKLWSSNRPSLRCQPLSGGVAIK